MSKFLWVISKNNLPTETNSKILAICEELVPDNIIVENHLIQVSEKVAFGISNPKNNICIHENSLMVGVLIGEYPNWHKPQSEFPDGSFALFRENEAYAEVVSDPAASRTIWYYFDEKQLIASTSQLAIVRYLGNFQFNPEAAAWMLSSGTLGPNLSWDKRLNRIMPDCCIILDKNTWVLKNKENIIEFKPRKKQEVFYENKLKNTLDYIFKNLKLKEEHWVLPLSGGYDSRAILFYLMKKKGKNIRTITWGLEDSLKDINNDAFIAEKLAIATGVQHEYLHTDLSKEPLEVLINRFIKNGEGRIDSISGYLDGFKIWEELHNKNIQGILRGDVGWAPTYGLFSNKSARKAVGLSVLKDFTNLKLSCLNNLEKQEIPEKIQLNTTELYLDWRDRLYHNFRIPTILAALSDLKLGYIEQSTPLLSRMILHQIREHPTKLRNRKYLFKKIVKSMFPEISFAKNSAVKDVEGFLEFSPVITYLKNELKNIGDNDIFEKEFVVLVIENIKTKEKETKTKKLKFISTIKKKLIPSYLKLLYKRVFKRNESHEEINLNYNLVAFRILIILKVNTLFYQK